MNCSFCVGSGYKMTDMPSNKRLLSSSSFPPPPSLHLSILKKAASDTTDLHLPLLLHCLVNPMNLSAKAAVMPAGEAKTQQLAS